MKTRDISLAAGLRPPLRLTLRTTAMALVVLVSVFSIAGLVLQPFAASAATTGIDSSASARHGSGTPLPCSTSPTNLIRAAGDASTRTTYRVPAYPPAPQPPPMSPVPTCPYPVVEPPVVEPPVVEPPVVAPPGVAPPVVEPPVVAPPGVEPPGVAPPRPASKVPTNPGTTNPGTTPQVSLVPSGGASLGGGSSAGPNRSSLMLGGGLLLAAAMTPLLGRRPARGKHRRPRWSRSAMPPM
jgi:hypothetical protein